MKLTEINKNKTPQFRGKARSVEELLASIKNGRFTLDGRELVVKDNLSLEDSKLTSLLGCPQVVHGNFSCAYNRLRTLEGAPQEVGGSFDCSDNQLKTLSGAPRVVNRSFYCSYNDLESLAGAPERVGNDFICYSNELKTLEGGPTNVGVSYLCGNNKLTTLKGMPTTINGDFWCENNLLTSLSGCGRIIKGNFNCMRNKLLTSLENGPDFVGGDVIFIGCTKLISLQNIHLHFPEVHGTFNFLNTGVKKHMLGLLRVRGLRDIAIGIAKLEAILRKYLKNGDIFACAVELTEAGYREQAKL
jgi:hypothetical protein